MKGMEQELCLGHLAGIPMPPLLSDMSMINENFCNARAASQGGVNKLSKQHMPHGSQRQTDRTVH